MLTIERRHRQIAANVVAEYVDELRSTGTSLAAAELLGFLLCLELIGTSPDEA